MHYDQAYLSVARKRPLFVLKVTVSLICERSCDDDLSPMAPDILV